MYVEHRHWCSASYCTWNGETMSWLGALAGGVENLLDRVDQVAGEALKDIEEPRATELSSARVGGFYVPEWPTTTRPTAIVSASAYSSFSHVGQSSPPPSSIHQVIPVCK